MPKTAKKLNDKDNIQTDIETLLEEVVDCKYIIREKLDTDPDNLSAHRMYCVYVGKILEIKKTIIQAQLTDQESLLLTALRSVVQTLIEKGEAKAAETVGSYLEEMGEKVRSQWLQPKEQGRAITQSGRSSKQRSRPSARTRPGKSKNASAKPVPI
ncbi:hypothetical protein MNBD_NITROSPINAE05-800 [hydrothermal vent metagenome]|uniref:Uncharacterized protein n=1 Tax=hydrothermal vent metagenome TaxID=652676 RepID=A0A3B1DHR4_9ZZZZ